MKACKRIAQAIFGLCLLVLALAAAAVPAWAVGAETPPSSTDQNYVLGPDDVIEVSVLGRDDFKTRTRIGQDGAIQLPYIGTVAAGSRTADTLGDQVAAALQAGGYFSHPIVKVEIVSYASRYVTVLGAVTTPGLIPIDRPYHLSEIIARVGGVKEDGADYVMVRSENGPQRQLSIKDLATGGADQDPLVAPGDKIYVPKAELFYISGQVKTPGAFPMLAGMTLRMALSRGGGITDLGSEGQVKVTRAGQVDHLKLDDKIQPGDVIVVGERLF